VIRVGTSGYQFKEWRGSFYPAGMPEADMLPFYTRHFPTVEINYTSYQMPTEKTLTGWAAATPDDFKLALKVPRRITYTRWAGAPAMMQTFCERARMLGDKVGPILLQTPQGFERDLGMLDVMLSLVPEDLPCAVELRHTSWFDDEVFGKLRERGVALCVSDTTELVTPVVQTGRVGYFRLRSGEYDVDDLQRWADTLRAWPGDAFVFFMHEDTGSGPRFAAALTDLLR
jgi:uncharacterized protein YecE (DUF72 family)